MHIALHNVLHIVCYNPKQTLAGKLNPMNISVQDLVFVGALVIALPLGVLLSKYLYDEPRSIGKAGIVLFLVAALIGISRHLLNEPDVRDTVASEAQPTAVISQPGTDSKESGQSE